MHLVVDTRLELGLEVDTHLLVVGMHLELGLVDTRLELDQVVDTRLELGQVVDTRLELGLEVDKHQGLDLVVDTRLELGLEVDTHQEQDIETFLWEELSGNK
jgi:hypothetical protein